MSIKNIKQEEGGEKLRATECLNFSKDPFTLPVQTCSNKFRSCEDKPHYFIAFSAKFRGTAQACPMPSPFMNGSTDANRIRIQCTILYNFKFCGSSNKANKDNLVLNHFYVSGVGEYGTGTILNCKFKRLYRYR